MQLIGVEAGGRGEQLGDHAARFRGGSPGVLQGTYSYVLQDESGQIATTHSVSAGLDYPSIGPEHAWLKDTGRAEYVPASDKEALEATHGAGADRRNHSGAGVGARGGGSDQARAEDEEVGDCDCEYFRARRQRYWDFAGESEVGFERSSGNVCQLRIANSQLQIPSMPFHFVKHSPRWSPMSPAAIPISRPRATSCWLPFDAGADVIELGVPFSDPVADGPVIQRASERALQARHLAGPGAGTGGGNSRAVAMAGLIIFTYLNPDPAHGNGEVLQDRAPCAGVDGALVTDLPVEEAGRLSAPRCERTIWRRSFWPRPPAPMSG